MSDRPRLTTDIAAEAASRSQPEDALRRLAELLGAAFARELASKQLPADDPSNLNADDVHSSPEVQL